VVARIAVVGAGVYGAAVAESLARRGAHVTVLDAGRPASGTSGATFSWTNSCGKQPRDYHELSVAGMVAHRKLAAEVEGSDWYHERGNVEWARTESGLASLATKVSSLLDYGYEVEWLTRDQLLRLEPDIDGDQLPGEGIAFYPREGWIEPARMVGHLLARARAHGAQLIAGDAVTALEDTGRGIATVVLASGTRVPVDAVVNCAGPGAGRIAAMAGLSLPMRNTRGVLVYTAPAAVTVGRVVHAPEVHLRPDGGGRLLLHTHEIDSAVLVDTAGACSVDPSAPSQVVDAANVLYPGIAGTPVESVRVGERPIPRDGLPVLGRTKRVANFFFAVSHSGATLSVHAGDLVAAEVMGTAQDQALAPFRFERLAAA
jgi:glycine/D-amino acid oxidase-like deaminating enzyme